MVASTQGLKSTWRENSPDFAEGVEGSTGLQGRERRNSHLNGGGRISLQEEGMLTADPEISYNAISKGVREDS